MSDPIAFRVLAADATMREIVTLLKADGIDHGSSRPVGGGTDPLNAPIDPELIRELTQAITVSIGSATAVFVFLEKLVDVSTRLRRKISILLSPTSTLITLETRQDLEKLKEEIEKLKNKR